MFLSYVSWSPVSLYEDLEVLEAIWKQDADLGVPRQLYEDESDDELEKENYKDSNNPLDSQFNKDKEPGKQPGGNSAVELAEDKPWQVANYTIDSETGELLAANESDDSDPTLNFDSPPSLHLNDDDPNFGLDFNLDEALKLVEFDQEGQEFKDSGSNSSCCSNISFSDGSSTDLDAIDASIDEMLQTSHFHGHSNVQGRLGGLVRSGSMEQRWQDLASLLSLPSPDGPHAQSPPTLSMVSQGTSPIHTHSHSHLPQPIHHPHPLYASQENSAGSGAQASGSRGLLLHNSTIPHPMPEHSAHNISYVNSMAASSHLVTSSMNLANNSDMAVDHQYKMDTNNMTNDMMYYQQQQQQHTPTPEIAQSNDGMWSSIINEEELQLMDIGMNEYNGRGNGEYAGNNYRYPPTEDPHRHPQKKHQLYGKRYFHENSPSTGASNLSQTNPSIGGAPVGVPLVGGYAPHYPSVPAVTPIENSTLNHSELKYSCSMDFRTPVVPGDNLDHVQHNHTYHLPSDGPSGMARSIKDRKGKRSDHDKNLTRDEKKAMSLNLPITCEDIINLPMDEFNERISKYDLSEAQLALIRDIRRRGKNKVAAQNCRKRKLDQIVHLAEEVKIIQYRKTELRSQIDHLTSERARVKHKFSILYRHIFQSLRDADGNPYSPHDFSLQQSADGSILLVPRSSAHQSIDILPKNINKKEEPSP